MLRQPQRHAQPHPAVLGDFGPGRQRKRQTGPPARDPRRLLGLAGFNPDALESGPQRVVLDAAEYHGAAPAGNRLGKIGFRLGDHDEDRRFARLLERLEQCVGRLVIHHAALLEEEDFSIPFHRRQAGQGDGLASLVDGDRGPAFWLDEYQVGMGGADHSSPARNVVIVTEQGSGKVPRRSRLTDAARPNEQIGVGRMCCFVGQQRRNRSVPDEALEEIYHLASTPAST